MPNDTNSKKFKAQRSWCLAYFFLGTVFENVQNLRMGTNVFNNIYKYQNNPQILIIFARFARNDVKWDYL